VQPPGRVYDHCVGAARAGRGKRVENYGRGIRTGFLLHDFNAGALAPNFQLFNRCGAKSVRGAKHHGVAFAAEAVREFAHGSGFADAVDAHHENYTRRGRAILRYRGRGAGWLKSGNQLPLQFRL